MGKGGGARIAPGNPRLFAEALAVQLDLTGVTAGEVLDAQRAIECLAAELAAVNATAADHARLRRLLAEAEATIGDNDAYHALQPGVPSRGRRSLAQPRAGRAVHVAASRLLAARNQTLTAEGRPPRARRAQGARRADRDARRRRRAPLMDDHVKMIRARRVAERDESLLTELLRLATGQRSTLRHEGGYA